MSSTLQERFPDADGAVCRTFFRTTDASDKTWRDVSLVAESDDRTFWTLVGHHKSLPLALRNLVTTVDSAHSSATRRQLQRDDEFALISLLVRLATTTSVASAAGVSVTSLSRRLEEIIPPSLLMPISLIILRQCGSIASATMTCLILHVPSYLCTMAATAVSWCDVTFRLAVRCVRELGRGRHQRLSGDVVPLFEEVYRHVKHIWALTHTAPFLADYIPLSRVLQYLRVVVDLISPVLQHFLLTCTPLSNRREQLSRANSIILNAAINTASILVLFRTYHRVGETDRYHCVENLPRSVYDTLTNYITEKVKGLPCLLLSNEKRPLTRILHELVAPEATTDDMEVGKVLRGLNESVPDSKDFSEGFVGVRPRYFELLLLDLVHQGFHIDLLLEKRFISPIEAEELGASEQVITQAIAGIIEEAMGKNTTLLTGGGGDSDNYIESSLVEAVPNVSSDPLVNIVLEVMPHFNVEGIKAALQYYNNDVEHFILDASMDNIVPHLLAQLMESSTTTATTTSNSITTAPTAPTNAAKQHMLTKGDYEDSLDKMDLNVLIGRDLYETINAEDDSTPFDDLAGDLAYTTYQPDVYRSSAEMFEVDEAMRDKIRMLTELMYEDEYDDTQDIVEVCAGGARESSKDSDTSPSDGEEEDSDNKNHNRERSGQKDTAALTNIQPRYPRTEYDEKRFHGNRAKERGKNIKAAKDARGEGAPAYTQKKKTTRKNTKDKMAVTRATRKGKIH